MDADELTDLVFKRFNQNLRCEVDWKSLVAVGNKVVCKWTRAAHFGSCEGGCTRKQNLPPFPIELNTFSLADQTVLAASLYGL